MVETEHPSEGDDHVTSDQLSAADKIRIRNANQLLRETNEEIIKDGGPDMIRGGRNLADVLRHALPDLDAVAVGRVCIELSEFMDGVILGGAHCGALMSMSLQTRAAGFDLTAVDWEEL
jgi:hypothetical protein